MKVRYFKFTQLNTLLYRHTELQGWRYRYKDGWNYPYSSPAELGIENWEDYELSDDDVMLELL